MTQNYWIGTNDIQSFENYELGIKRTVIVLSFFAFFTEV